MPGATQISAYVFSVLAVLVAIVLVVLDHDTAISKKKVNLRLKTKRKPLPWLAIAAVPAIALCIAAMETESESSHGWAARFGTIKLIGGFTAYHLCLGLSVVLLCHLPWLFTEVENWREGVQLERGIVVIVLLLFALEDIGFYQTIHVPTTYFSDCGNDGVRILDCFRGLGNGSIQSPVASFLPLVAAALLVGADTSTFTVVGGIVGACLVLIMFPGYFIRRSYALRELRATTAPGFEARAALITGLQNLERTQGVDGLRLLMEAWRPVPELFRKERASTTSG
jgi:hypothetical protein